MFIAASLLIPKEWKPRRPPGVKINQGLSIHSPRHKKGQWIQEPACRNLGDSAAWKKPVPKGYTLYDSLYITFLK